MRGEIKWKERKGKINNWKVCKKERKKESLPLYQPALVEPWDPAVPSWQPVSFRSDYQDKLQLENLSLVIKVNDPAEQIKDYKQ